LSSIWKIRVTNYEKYPLFALFSQLFFDFLKVAEVRKPFRPKM